MDPEKILPPRFRPQALVDAEAYFKNVHMTQEQHRIFNDFVQIVLKFIKQLDPIAAKGIGWRAVSKWQLKYKRDLAGLESSDDEDRIKGIIQLLEFVKEELYAVLEDPSDKAGVDKAMGEVLAFYKETYAKR